DDALQAASAIVLDDDARIWSEIDPEIGVDTFWISDGCCHTVVDETPSQRAALDQKFDLEHTRQDPVKGPDDQLVLTDGQRTHSSTLYGSSLAHKPAANFGVRGRDRPLESSDGACASHQPLSVCRPHGVGRLDARPGRLRTADLRGIQPPRAAARCRG